MIIGMLGGMIGPIAPPAATSAAEKPSRYPFSFIDGISSAPTAAVSATAEPDRPANSIDSTAATCASPPRIRPTSANAKSISLREMPPSSIRLPASMKNGTASSVKLSTP